MVSGATVGSGACVLAGASVGLGAGSGFGDGAADISTSLGTWVAAVGPACSLPQDASTTMPSSHARASIVAERVLGKFALVGAMVGILHSPDLLVN